MARQLVPPRFASASQAALPPFPYTFTLKTIIMKQFKILLTCTFCILFLTLKSQDTLNYSIYFDTDKYSLSNANIFIIDSLIAKLDNNLKYKFEIISNTDSVGTYDYNLSLSKKRSNSVYNYIITKNTDTSLISIKNLGKTNPKSKLLEINRRVDFIITYNKPPIIASKKDTLENLDRINDLYLLLSNKNQSFNINTNKDTIIVGKQGTIIIFPANCFQRPDTLKKSDILITLKEIYNVSDMIIENLSTTSNNKLLETDGMIKIEAFENGRPIKLNKLHPIIILMPTETSNKEMTFFNGEESEDIINWLPMENPNAMILPKNGFNDFGKYRLGFLRQIMRLLGINSARRIIKNEGEYINLTEFEEKYKNVKIDKLESIPKSDLEYYVFNSQKLGWINCDRFLNEPVVNLITFKIDEKFSKDTNIKIVYKSIKSIMPSYSNRHFSYPNSLKEQEIWIVGLKYIDNTPYLALKETVINKNQEHNLDFKPYPLDELITELKKLNR